MTKPEHEYVEYQLEFKDGEIVRCNYFGEGRQVEPVTDVMVLKVMDGASGDIGRIERRLKRAFGKLA